MKKNCRRRALALLLGACVLFALLCGCTGKDGDTDAPALVTPSTPEPSAAPASTPAPAPAPESPAPTEQGTEAPELPELPEDVQPLADAAKNVVVVHNTQELIEAIAPDTAIVVEPGDYNLSEYLQAAWGDNRDGGKNVPLHRYAELVPCVDGIGLLVKGANRLSIFGRGAAEETELVVEPRYADVLHFEDCADVSLARLTMGHTETGNCVGSVLGFEDCRNIDLYAMDLYGCGVYGIFARNTSDLRAHGCVIRDCSYGPLDLEDVTGEWLFEDCVMRGSDGGGYIDTYEGADVSFIRCTFGEWESNGLYYRDDITTEDCFWYEITQFPHVDPEYEGALEPTEAEEELIADTAWLGQSMYNFTTQEETMLPLRREGCLIDVVLRLNADGSGTLEGLEDEPLLLRWEPDTAWESRLLVAMQGEYAETGNAELYRQIYAEGQPLWLELWLGEMSFRFKLMDGE